MEIENENEKVKKTGSHKKWLIAGIAVICVAALVVAGTILIRRNKWGRPAAILGVVRFQ